MAVITDWPRAEGQRKRDLRNKSGALICSRGLCNGFSMGADSGTEIWVSERPYLSQDTQLAATTL